MIVTYGMKRLRICPLKIALAREARIDSSCGIVHIPILISSGRARASEDWPPPKEQPPRKLSGKVDRLELKRWKAGDLFS
jgi:hypothetical protein